VADAVAVDLASTDLRRFDEEALLDDIVQAGIGDALPAQLLDCLVGVRQGVAENREIALHILFRRGRERRAGEKRKKESEERAHAAMLFE